jgi:hypothetical protein
MRGGIGKSGPPGQTNGGGSVDEGDRRRACPPRTTDGGGWRRRRWRHPYRVAAVTYGDQESNGYDSLCVGRVLPVQEAIAVLIATGLESFGSQLSGKPSTSASPALLCTPRVPGGSAEAGQGSSSFSMPSASASALLRANIAALAAPATSGLRRRRRHPR